MVSMDRLECSEIVKTVKGDKENEVQIKMNKQVNEYKEIIDQISTKMKIHQNKQYHFN